MVTMMTLPFLRPTNRLLPISLALVGLLLAALWVFQSRVPVCDPQAAEAELGNSADKGIHGTNRPPSASNLLWVHVGPRWHTLPQVEKKALDKLVRCAATTIDEQGHPTWQAAYYDAASGEIAALSSRQYGFRLKRLR